MAGSTNDGNLGSAQKNTEKKSGAIVWWVSHLHANTAKSYSIINSVQQPKPQL